MWIYSNKPDVLGFGYNTVEVSAQHNEHFKHGSNFTFTSVMLHESQENTGECRKLNPAEQSHSGI